MADLVNSLDLNLLKVFRALLQTQSTTQAAARLNMSQSAVSRSLSKLRASFNDPLFEWRGNTMQPSIVAQSVAPEIELALTNVEHALSQVRQFDPETANTCFTLGLTDYAIYAIFPHLFRRVQAVAPNVAITMRNVNMHNALQCLRDGEVDYAIMSQSVDTKEFDADQLFTEDYAIIGDQRFVSHPPGEIMDLDAYLAHPHSLCSFSGSRHGWVDDQLESMGQTRNIQFVFEAFFPMIANLSGTRLLATVPRRLVRFAGEKFGLSHWELPFPTVNHTFHLVMRRQQRLTPARAWFRETVLSISVSDGPTLSGLPSDDLKA